MTAVLLKVVRCHKGPKLAICDANLCVWEQEIEISFCNLFSPEAGAQWTRNWFLPSLQGLVRGNKAGLER